MLVHSYRFVALLGALSALPPMAIDTGLPGLPSLESTFPDAVNRGALTLSVFLIGFAIAPLAGGPLADRFGRRIMALLGLSCFAISAAGCAIAPSFPALLTLRLFQGVSAGLCSVLPFAIVRDKADEGHSRVLMSKVMMTIGIAPLIAPILGSMILPLGGWRVIYLAQAIFAFLLLFLCWSSLGETLAAGDRVRISPRSLTSNYLAAIREPTYRRFTLMYSLCFACKFAYISGSASVLMGTLGLDANSYAVTFAITSCGLLVGSYASGKLAQRSIPAARLVGFGIAIMAIGASINLLAIVFGIIDLTLMVPVVVMITITFGIVAPNAIHAAVLPIPQIAGTASGLIRCVQMSLGAGAGVAVAGLTSYTTAEVAMGWAMAAPALLAFLMYLSPTWQGKQLTE